MVRLRLFQDTGDVAVVKWLGLVYFKKLGMWAFLNVYCNRYVSVMLTNFCNFDTISICQDVLFCVINI